MCEGTGLGVRSSPKSLPHRSAPDGDPKSAPKSMQIAFGPTKHMVSRPGAGPESHLDQQNVWFSDLDHFSIDGNRTRTQGITTFPPFDTRRIRIWTNKTYGFLILITSASMEIVPAPKKLQLAPDIAFGSNSIRRSVLGQSKSIKVAKTV